MTTKDPSHPRRRGQALVEFTFVGIPLIFILVCVFEMSRGMWLYHTLAFAVKDGVRYASVHGYDCTNNGNTCTVTMQNVAAVIRNAGVGLDPASTTLNFYTLTSSSGAKILTTGSPCSLDTTTNPCSSTNIFPPPSCNSPRACRIEIDITTPFNSALAMFWPGASPVSFASGTLGATSADAIQY